MSQSDDNIILVGDLVAVVSGAPCCGFNPALGLVFTAKDIVPKRYFKLKCRSCGFVFEVHDALVDDGVGQHHLQTMCQKIRPPKKKQTIDTKEIHHG